MVNTQFISLTDTSACLLSSKALARVRQHVQITLPSQSAIKINGLMMPVQGISPQNADTQCTLFCLYHYVQLLVTPINIIGFVNVSIKFES